MATPRISWDVSVSASLQTGTWLTRWEEESSSSQVLFFTVDQYGFYLAWREDDKEANCLDLCSVSEVRLGGVPKDIKLRDTLQNERADIILEDRSFTLVYGQNLVDVSYLHLCADSTEIADEWISGLRPLLHNLKIYNASILTQLLKLYVKLGHLASTSGKIAVKSISKCLSVGKYEQRVLEGLEAMKLPHGKNDELDHQSFTFEQFYQLYLKVCARFEIEQLCLKCGGKGLSLNVNQLVNFLNQEQRDPRLNEILYPYYNKDRALSLIWKYEKSLDNLQRDRITVNGLTRYLLSEDNLLMMPNRIEVYQDMTQPLSHYFINSSHNTYLIGRQFGGKSSVEMYRQCLLAGCRCIELDCWDGPGDDPIITHGKAMCTNILFKDVIEAIHESAFTTSEYPVILSFENHCSKSQQYKMACYCIDIFGDMLLTKPLDSHPLEEGKSLPSPSHLKRKIIIKNKKLKPEQESEAESFYDFSEIASDFETTDTSALRVGSIKETAIIDDDIEEEDNVEENNHDEDISQNLSSPELDNQSVTSDDLNKILEYSERVCNELLQESTLTAVEESLTNNKVVTLEDIKRYSSVLISKILNEAGLNGLERDYVSAVDSRNSADSQVVALVADDCSSEESSVSQTSSRTSEEVDKGFHSQNRLSEISFTSTLSAGSEVSTDSDSENLASVLTPTVTVTASGETFYDFSSLKEASTSSTEVVASHKPFRINGGLESIQEVSDHWENGEDLSCVDDFDNSSSKSERTKFHIDFQPEENPEENGKVTPGVLQCNGKIDGRRTQSALQGTNSDSPATQSSMKHARDSVSNDQTIVSRRKESNASTQSVESNPDEEEERDIVNEYRKREEKLAIFGSSLKLNMGGKKGSRAASLTPEDWEAFSQFTSNYQTTGNIHPYLSSLVNYIHPVPFNGFDEAEKKNMCHHISSFNESTGFGLLKASPVEFVKYNKRQLSRIYPKGSRVDSSNYMPQVFWNVGCQMVSLNFQTSDLAFQLNDGKFEYNARCGYILKPDLMRRTDRLFDPFTESVIDGMVAASVIIKVISGQFLSDKKISTYVEVDMYGLPTDTLRKKYKTKLVPNNGMDPAYGDFEDDKINFEFKRVVLPELALLRFAVMDDNDKLVAQRVVPLDGLQSGFRHISLRTENNFPMPLATLFCQISLKTYIPERYTDIVDELSEPIKYRSAADKRAAQMVVFGIDEIEDDSNVPPFLKTSASCSSLSRIKAPSLTSINNSTAVCNFATSKARESIVTLSYSGARSASEITLVESNLPKKYDFKFSPVIVEELKKDKAFIKVFKKHQKENEALTKRYTKERTAMQRVHTAELEKLITNYEKIKIAAIRRFDRVVRRSEDERSDELRKVHESQMLYLNKTQTDKAKEKLSLQTEEWTNMINRQVEEQIGIYEQQAEMQLDTLNKVMDTAHESQLKEVGARHEKENTEITKRQTRQSIESVRALLLDKNIKSKEERDRRQRELDKQNLKRFYDERETLSDRQKREIEELKNQQKEEKKNLDAEYRKIMADHMDEIKTNGEKSRKAIHTAFQTILPSH